MRRYGFTGAQLAKTKIPQLIIPAFNVVPNIKVLFIVCSGTSEGDNPGERCEPIALSPLVVIIKYRNVMDKTRTISTLFLDCNRGQI